MDPSPLLVARVVPDVTGLDKQFDYLVPEPLRARVAVGSMVRVPLHGRRVGGWVVSLGPPDGSVPVERLVPLAKWSGIGPSAEIIDLARWASMRWGAGRVRPFLVAGSPPGDGRLAAAIDVSTERPRSSRSASAPDPAPTDRRSDDGARGGVGIRSNAGHSPVGGRGAAPCRPPPPIRLLDRGASRPVGTRRRRRRRGDRRQKRGVVAVRGHAIDRGARRARRGPAGGTLADLARPRRRHRTRPPRRCAVCLGLTVSFSHRIALGRRFAAANLGHRGARRLADPRNGRPHT